MATETRRKFSEEFKREAVRQLELRGNRSGVGVAAGLGVKLSQIYDWRRKYADTAAAARQERGESPEEEVKRLRREVAELRKDREILKKAAAFFAKDGDR